MAIYILNAELWKPCTELRPSIVSAVPSQDKTFKIILSDSIFTFDCRGKEFQLRNDPPSPLPNCADAANGWCCDNKKNNWSARSEKVQQPLIIQVPTHKNWTGPICITQVDRQFAFCRRNLSLLPLPPPLPPLSQPSSLLMRSGDIVSECGE